MGPEKSYARGWVTVVLAAILMLATLPGRTQGLGLITEPLLRDLQLDRIAYAHMNLWATLIGAVVCIPFGSLLDRFGIRWTTATVVVLLGVVVWGMSVQTGRVVTLFLLILATRALGQSALSVASITAVGKSFGQKVGMAMGVYSVLVGLFFAVAFTLVGGVVRAQGWRAAWSDVAIGLFVVAALVVLFLHTPADVAASDPTDPGSTTVDGLTLLDALRTPAFWIFAGSASLFGLVSSGLGLFNEAVLAERGFDQRTYYAFLTFTSVMGLVGQLLCGWLTLRRPMQHLLGLGMFLYAVALAGFPFLRTLPQLWTLGVLSGMSGGFITVLFFAIWSRAFGRARLGWIQGAAQMLTVLASAVGPLLFAACAEMYGSYMPALWTLAPVVVLLGVTALRVRLPKGEPSPSPVPEIA